MGGIFHPGAAMSKSQPKPKLLFMITEQPRRMLHWSGQVDREQFCPSMGLLTKIGAVEFGNTFITSSMCSPSRCVVDPRMPATTDAAGR